VLSAARWPELENALAEAQSRVAPAWGGHDLNDSRVLQPNALGVRGIQSIQNSASARLESFDAEAVQTNQSVLVPISAPIVGGHDSAVVVERFFRHVSR